MLSLYRGRYARGVRVTIADVRSCCCNGILLSAGIERLVVRVTWCCLWVDAAMVHDDARFPAYNCLRRRFVIDELCVRESVPEIFLAKLRAKYVPVYLGAFTARANRESRAKHVKLPWNKRRTSCARFICAFNADNVRFRAWEVFAGAFRNKSTI